MKKQSNLRNYTIIGNVAAVNKDTLAKTPPREPM